MPRGPARASLKNRLHREPFIKHLPNITLYILIPKDVQLPQLRTCCWFLRLESKSVLTRRIPRSTLANMGVSKNRGTPKSWILIGFSIINHPFWGTLLFGNTHIAAIPRCGFPKDATKRVQRKFSSPVNWRIWGCFIAAYVVNSNSCERSISKWRVVRLIQSSVKNHGGLQSPNVHWLLANLPNLQQPGSAWSTPSIVKGQKTSWPLVGNEGMNPQYTNVKVDSLIPY